MRLLAILPLLAPAAPQERPPRFDPPVAHEPASAAALALVPGVLPASATPEARAAWERVCAATLPPGAERVRVEAFELVFDLVTQRGVQTNEAEKMRFRFLAPGWIRTSLRSGREQLRGPDGDWLIDGKERVQLVGSRESKEDLRQLDEALAIARNFVALTDPRSLRIASIAIAAAPPAGLPEELRARAGELDWIDVTSPDFGLVRRSAPGAGTFRVQLGVERAQSRIELAIVGEDRGAKELQRSSVLVELADLRPLDGFLIPFDIRVHEVEPESRPLRFGGASMKLWLRRESTLRPKLAAEDFRPVPAPGHVGSKEPQR